MARRPPVCCLGRKDLITAAKYNSPPWEGAVCRPMKVGKEEIMGVLAAVDYWSTADLTALNKEWQARVERIEAGRHRARRPDRHLHPHRRQQLPDPHRHLGRGRSSASPYAQCDAALRANTPRIEVLTASNPSVVLARDRANEPTRPGQTPRPNRLQIISMTMQPGEDLIVGNTLRQILEKARKSASA